MASFFPLEKKCTSLTRSCSLETHMLDLAAVPRWQARFGSHFYSHHFVCSLPRWFNVLNLYASRTMRCKRRPPCGCNFRSLNNISHEIYELVVRIWAAAATVLFESNNNNQTQMWRLRPLRLPYSLIYWEMNRNEFSIPHSSVVGARFIHLVLKNAPFASFHMKRRHQASTRINILVRRSWIPWNCRTADTLIARNSNYQSFGRVWWMWMNLDVFDRVENFQFHLAVAIDTQQQSRRMCFSRKQPNDSLAHKRSWELILCNYAIKS